MKLKRWKLAVYLGTFLVFLFIFSKVPYCHDEWAWGLPGHLEMLDNWFDGYNGRYLGNLLALLLTRSLLAKALIPSVMMLTILILMGKLVCGNKEEKQELFYLTFCAFFLFAIPKSLFNQTYGWVAAFVNFIPPVLLFLLYDLLVIKGYVAGDTGSVDLKKTIFLIPICLSAQLFSEHNTIFHVIFAGAVLVYGLVRYHKIRRCDVVAFVSFAAGAFLMFSNSAYRNAANDTDGYKHIWFSIRPMIEGYVDRISDNMLLNNWVLNGILAGVLVFLLAKKIRNRFIGIEITLVLAAYEIFSIWHKVYPDWVFFGNDFRDDCVRAFLGIVFYLHVLAAIWIVTKKEERIGILRFYLSAAMVSAPLLMANPIGSRCFYVSYLFQVMAVILLCKTAIPKDADLSYPVAVLLAATLVIAFVYLWMFREIGRYNEVRAQQIKAAVEQEEKTVQLPILPYPDYCWQTVPPSQTWEKRFKKFYGLPKDVELIFYEPQR